jgi:hypothetical protein
MIVEEIEEVVVEKETEETEVEIVVETEGTGRPRS